MRIVWGLWVCLACWACGDDDAGTASPLDMGDAVDEGVDDGGAEVDRSLSYRVVDPDGAPIEGAFVTVDVEAGRFEGVSDGAGMTMLDVRLVPGELITRQAAKEGFVIDAATALYDPEAEPEMPIEVELPPLVAGLGDRAPVRLELTGLPAAAHACVAYGSFSLCFEDDVESLDASVPVASINPDGIAVSAIEVDGSLHDFVSVPLTGDPESGFDAAVVFDGTPEPALEETRDILLRVPEGETSRLATGGAPPEIWGQWMFRADIEERRAGSTCARATRTEDGDIAVKCHFLALTGDLQWGVAAYPDITTGSGSSFLAFTTTDPGDDVDLLGTARITTGAEVDGAFSFEGPVMAPGTRAYFIMQVANASGVVHRRQTLGHGDTRAEGIHFPALPSGYDRSVSYPFEGSGGVATVQTLEADMSGPEPVILRFSNSEEHPVTF